MKLELYLKILDNFVDRKPIKREEGKMDTKTAVNRKHLSIALVITMILTISGLFLMFASIFVINDTLEGFICDPWYLYHQGYLNSHETYRSMVDAIKPIGYIYFLLILGLILLLPTLRNMRSSLFEWSNAIFFILFGAMCFGLIGGLTWGGFGGVIDGGFMGGIRGVLIGIAIGIILRALVGITVGVPFVEVIRGYPCPQHPSRENIRSHTQICVGMLQH